MISLNTPEYHCTVTHLPGKYGGARRVASIRQHYKTCHSGNFYKFTRQAGKENHWKLVSRRNGIFFLFGESGNRFFNWQGFVKACLLAVANIDCPEKIFIFISQPFWNNTHGELKKWKLLNLVCQMLISKFDGITFKIQMLWAGCGGCLEQG